MKGALFGAAVTAAVLIGPQSLAWGQETIDFENNCNGVPGACAAGTIVSTIEGDLGTVVGVNGTNPILGATNAAMIFDSSCPPGGIPTDCSGGDLDLGTPNQAFGGPGVGAAGASNTTALGNVLIITEDLNSGNPDDADVIGAGFSFDFPGDVTVDSIAILDVEANEPSATVELFDSTLTSLGVFSLPQVGDNGVAVVGLGPTSGVRQMVVVLNGSGAIDNIVFTPEDGGGEGCTPGYWKNHLEDWPPTGLSPADDFDTTFGVDLFSPDITLQQAVNAKGGGVKKLARHGTAALLSALHPDVDYPLTPAEVIAAVQAGDANTLVAFNELGCQID